MWYCTSTAHISHSSEGATGGHSDSTPTEDLPGNRLLGRAQARRSTLNQKLSAQGRKPRKKETRLTQQSSQPFDIRSMPLTTHGQHTDEVMGHMTPTQRLILNHLGMLQNPDEDAILGDLNHNLPSALSGYTATAIIWWVVQKLDHRLYKIYLPWLSRTKSRRRPVNRKMVR